MMGGFYTKKHSKKSQKSVARHADGFTIIEALIVLAVTGVLFVSIIGVVSGKQSKAQFMQGINSIRGEIEQVINEVQSGYYPEVDDQQGTKQEDMSIGKVIQFNNPPGTDPERYTIYSLTAKRNITEIRADTPVSVVESATQVNPLKYGLTTKWMSVGLNRDVNAVGFITFFASGNASVDSMYGSQTTQIIPIASTGDIGGGLASEYVNNRNPSEGVSICFNGNNGQSGLITIGGDKQSNSVTLSIRNGDDCG